MAVYLSLNYILTQSLRYMEISWSTPHQSWISSQRVPPFCLSYACRLGSPPLVRSMELLLNEDLRRWPSSVADRYDKRAKRLCPAIIPKGRFMNTLRKTLTKRTMMAEVSQRGGFRGRLNFGMIELDLWYLDGVCVRVWERGTVSKNCGQLRLPSREGALMFWFIVEFFADPGLLVLLTLNLMIVEWVK